MAKLLVVAAWEPELLRFRERSGGEGPRGLELVLAALGVGVVEAAIAMTRCVAEHRPAGALFLGTCGAFAGSSLAVGDVVTAGRARLLDAAVVDGAAALPGPMPVEVSFDDALRSALASAGAKSVHVANTLGITTDDALAARLARAGDHHVEHLEAFAFARACALAGVPCAVSLGVANAVGSRGRGEWLANHVQASANAADVAFAALPAIAAALAAAGALSGASATR